VSLLLSKPFGFLKRRYPKRVGTERIMARRAIARIEVKVCFPLLKLRDRMLTMEVKDISRYPSRINLIV